MNPLEVGALILVLVAVAASFFVSASAGLGGSLVLVPTLAMLLGTKEGIALSALLLAFNNGVKVVAYRRVLPFRTASGIVVAISIGAFVGARVLVDAPETVVTVGVIVVLVSALVVEDLAIDAPPPGYAPTLALASGATSGFSGTSGPLKGVAIKSLGLDRFHTVGAAALASLFGDATKLAVFADAALLDTTSWYLAVAAVPLMLVATFAGRRFNETIGERGYRRLFWVVMGGYTARLFIVL